MLRPNAMNAPIPPFLQLGFQSRLALTYARECLYGRLAPEQQQKHKGLAGRPFSSWWPW